MLNKLSRLQVSLRRLPPLFCVSFGALLGLLTVAFVLGERAEQKQAELLREYGTALAQISAQDVIESSIGNDLVSMHAVMQRVVSQPRVLRAAVHDLNQQLQVQAGQSSIREYDRTETFTAPIPLHDSVAGHVTITMDAGFPGEVALKWTLMGTSVLLMILAGLALFEARGDAWHLEPPSEKDDEFEGKEDLVDQLLSETDEFFQRGVLADQHDENLHSRDFSSASAAPVDGHIDTSLVDQPSVMYSDLVIALPNRARLEKQLSGERFAQMSAQFETTVNDVLEVYGGARVGAHADAGIVCVRFASSESLAEGAFRAVCSAYLIQALTRLPKVHFHMVAEVCHPDADVKLAVSETGIFIHQALIDPFLFLRVETEAVSDERIRFVRFKGAFAALLERQQEQLQNKVHASAVS